MQKTLYFFANFVVLCISGSSDKMELSQPNLSFNILISSSYLFFSNSPFVIFLSKELDERLLLCHIFMHHSQILYVCPKIHVITSLYLIILTTYHRSTNIKLHLLRIGNFKLLNHIDNFIAKSNSSAPILPICIKNAEEFNDLAVDSIYNLIEDSFCDKIPYKPLPIPPFKRKRLFAVIHSQQTTLYNLSFYRSVPFELNFLSVRINEIPFFGTRKINFKRMVL